MLSSNSVGFNYYFFNVSYAGSFFDGGAAVPYPANPIFLYPFTIGQAANPATETNAANIADVAKTATGYRHHTPDTRVTLNGLDYSVSLLNESGPNLDNWVNAQVVVNSSVTTVEQVEKLSAGATWGPLGALPISEIAYDVTSIIESLPDAQTLPCPQGGTLVHAVDQNGTHNVALEQCAITANEFNGALQLVFTGPQAAHTGSVITTTGLSVTSVDQDLRYSARLEFIFNGTGPLKTKITGDLTGDIVETGTVIPIEMKYQNFSMDLSSDQAGAITMENFQGKVYKGCPNSWIGYASGSAITQNPDGSVEALLLFSKPNDNNTGVVSIQRNSSTGISFGQLGETFQSYDALLAKACGAP